LKPNKDIKERWWSLVTKLYVCKQLSSLATRWQQNATFGILKVLLFLDIVDVKQNIRWDQARADRPLVVLKHLPFSPG